MPELVESSAFNIEELELMSDSLIFCTVCLDRDCVSTFIKMSTILDKVELMLLLVAKDSPANE
jgi:hypothetical protein